MMNGMTKEKVIELEKNTKVEELDRNKLKKEEKKTAKVVRMKEDRIIRSAMANWLRKDEKGGKPQIHTQRNKVTERIGMFEKETNKNDEKKGEEDDGRTEVRKLMQKFEKPRAEKLKENEVTGKKREKPKRKNGT